MKLQAKVVTMSPDTSLTSPDWPELRQQRRAIVVVDVVESVRLMQANEADVIDRWRRFVNEVRTQVLPVHGGRLVKSLGDGLLLEFENVPAAVAAATDARQRIAPFNLGRSAALAMRLRMGVHVADVLVDELDIYGAGVNLAARVASLAAPDEIVVTAAVRDCLVPGLDVETFDLGDCYVKHLDEPVRAYRLEGVRAASSEAVADPETHGPSFAPTLIVLPIECSADVSVDHMVADLLTDSLIATLSLNHDLNVIARLSTTALNGRRGIPSAFLQDIGADFALKGRCHVIGSAVSASFELIETRRGTLVWSGFGRDQVASMLLPRCELIQSVCGDVSAALIRMETVLGVSQPLPSLQGHAIQVGAISLMHRSSREEFQKVGAMLEYLIERHARVAAPRAWLAKWYVLRVTRGVVEDPAEDARRALDQTRRAIDADPSCALALAMEGFVYCHLLRDLDRASDRLDRATAVGPNEPLAWLFRGVVHAFRDEGALAVQCTERALALSPIDPLKYYMESLSAAAAVAAGQFDRAVELAQRSLASNALHTSTYRTLAIAQSLRGDAEAAHDTVRRMLVLDPSYSIERFLARVPSGASTISTRFAQALADAGVPRRGGRVLSGGSLATEGEK